MSRRKAAPAASPDDAGDALPRERPLPAPTADRPRYHDRRDAGRVLARVLAALPLAPPVVVLALPRGGVPVALEVARALKAPLDLLLVRKIGAPWQPELAVAAVVDGDPPVTVVDDDAWGWPGVDVAWIEAQVQAELREIARRRAVYLRGRAPQALAGRTVVLVDDGIATGTTVRAALQALRGRRPARLVLAVPVAPPETVARLRVEVDDLVCPWEPQPFDAIGCFYDDFHQLADDEVIAGLDEAARWS